jgi:cephalosporin hydroxylase
MNSISEFKKQVERNISALGEDQDLKRQACQWMIDGARHNYVYNFSWMGRPIIQFPQDIVAMQELIWSIKPDLIIETGIAHGGSLILSASLLAQLDMCDAIEAGIGFKPNESRRKVLGVDIDIRSYNREAIETHPMASRIQMIQCSSISPETVELVKQVASGYERILVCLDSNHTHEHVMAELEAYALLTSVGSYCVVFDTLVEDCPPEMFADRPWGRGNNPKTAVWSYLKSHPEFVIDKNIHDKLMITVAPDGYLKRIA